MLLGEFGDDKLVGNQGNDHLEGGSETDNIDGGAGDDELFGSDSIVHTAERDVFQYNSTGGADTIFDFDVGLDQIFVSGILEDLIDTEDNDLLNASDGPVSVSDFAPGGSNDLRINFRCHTLTVANLTELTVGETESILFV